MSEKFVSNFRFGWETEPTGTGSEGVVVSKIDTYGELWELTDAERQEMQAALLPNLQQL